MALSRTRLKIENIHISPLEILRVILSYLNHRPCVGCATQGLNIECHLKVSSKLKEKSNFLWCEFGI